MVDLVNVGSGLALTKFVIEGRVHTVKMSRSEMPSLPPTPR